MTRSKVALFFVFVIALSNSLFAQKYFQASDEEFGRSKVQYKDLQWKTIASQNFEYNYYNGGDAYARKAAKIAEGEFGRITETLGYVPFMPVKIFVYNSPDDLKQSNIVQSNFEESDSYVSLSKARIQLPYQKNDSLFREKLIRQITNLYVGDMLYGGSLKESMQNKILLSVPDWFVNGISAYMVGNNVALSKVQELITKNTNLDRLNKADAEIIGQSIWNYIAIRYGKDKISNILNLTRIIRNEKSSITSTLNVPYAKFVKEWRNFYLNNNGVYLKDNANIKKEDTKKVIVPDGQPLKDLKPNEVDTDFYVFDVKNLDKFRISQGQEITKVDSSKLKVSDIIDPIKLSRPRAFQNYLVRSDLDIGVKADPIRRFGFTGNMVFHDVLENNVITLNGYMRLATSIFKNYDYSIEYARYSGRIDFKFKYTKRSIDLSSLNDTTNYIYRPLNFKSLDYNIHRIISQNFAVTGIYPISRVMKLDFGAAIIKATDIDYTLPGNGIITDTYLNPNFSFVYDNTNFIDEMNEVGTRAKVTFEKNMVMKNNLLNFGRFNLDVRHYQKIAKGLILAGRFSYGKSTGNAPKATFIGGVENYLNRSVYSTDLLSSGAVGNLKDILFYNFDSNLRGFEFARLYGNNHMVINIEARLSLLSYLPPSSLNSSMLRNLQLVVFNDIGTAWNGNNGPFSKQNSVNNSKIGESSSPFFATVTTFQNPFLMGFGAGVRTVILGLNVKADYAIGRQNKVNNSGMFYLSIGKNF